MSWGLTLIYLNRINPGLAASGRQKSYSECSSLSRQADGMGEPSSADDGDAVKKNASGWRHNISELLHTSSRVWHFFNSLEKKPCCLLGKFPGLLQYMPEPILHEIHAV